MVFLSDEKHLIPSNLKKGDWKNERKNKVARQADTGQEIRSFLPFSPDCIVTFFVRCTRCCANDLRGRRRVLILGYW